MEAVGCVATVMGMMNYVRRLFDMVDQVNQTRTEYWHLMKRLLRSVELLEDLMKRRDDLNEDPALYESLSQSLADVERLTNKAAELFKERKGIRAVKSFVLQRWKLGDTRAEIERIKKELDDCLHQFSFAGILRVGVAASKAVREVSIVKEEMRSVLFMVQAKAQGQNPEVAPPQDDASRGVTLMVEKQPSSQETSPSTKPPSNDDLDAKIGTLLHSLKDLTAKAHPSNSGQIADLRLVPHRYVPKVGDPTDEKKDAIEKTLQLTGQLSGENLPMSPEELGQLLCDLGLLLVDLGWNDQAIEIMELDVKVHRQLCAQHPSIFQPHVARSLHNSAVALWSMNHKERALKSIEEAVEIYRSLSQNFPVSFEQDLARSLTVLSNQADAMGRKEDGMKFIKEAVDVFTKLSRKCPADFEPDLASSLHNYAKRLNDQGCKEKALETISEAVEIRRSLVRDFPSKFEADLALSLVSLSGHMSRAKRERDATTAIQEAVNLYRQLAQDRPKVFEPLLVSSLISLSFCFCKLSQRDSAFAQIRDGMQIFQKSEISGLQGMTTARQLEGLLKHYRSLGWDEHISCIEQGIAMRKAGSGVA